VASGEGPASLNGSTDDVPAFSESSAVRRCAQARFLVSARVGKVQGAEGGPRGGGSRTEGREGKREPGSSQRRACIAFRAAWFINSKGVERPAGERVHLELAFCCVPLPLREEPSDSHFSRRNAEAERWSESSACRRCRADGKKGPDPIRRPDGDRLNMGRLAGWQRDFPPRDHPGARSPMVDPRRHPAVR